MRYTILGLAVLLVAPMRMAPGLPVVASAHAEDAAVAVQNPCARATPGVGTTAAVYLTLTARGAADRLIGVSTPAAGMAMVHESYAEGSVSRMRMLDNVPLPAGVAVTFRPGALHIMLEGLVAPLKVGASFPLTLTFLKAPPRTVAVTVLKPGAAGPAAADMKDMQGMKMP